MEPPLFPIPNNRPMMKGRLAEDASHKPTFQGIWGMTHADVTKPGGVNLDFKVVRLEAASPKEQAPLFPGQYMGYFKMNNNLGQVETITEKFTLEFRPHTNSGHNVYGYGENKYGANEIVGTITQNGKMEIYKMIPGTVTRPETVSPAALQPRPMTKPTGSSSSSKGRAGQEGGFTGGGRKKSVGGGGTKKKGPKGPDPPPNKAGLPGAHVKILKECVNLLRKKDKLHVFAFPVATNYVGPAGKYSDIVKQPMDFNTIMTNIDEKYRTALECVTDIRLVFSNAKLFNLDTDPVHALAGSLSGTFEAFVVSHYVQLGLDRSAGSHRSGDQKGLSAMGAAVVSAASAGAGPGKRLAPTSSTSPSKQDPHNKGLSWSEQDALARDVNELFRLGNEQPGNEKAQARVYALWTFAQAYVTEKDRILVNSGKGAEIRVRMDALNASKQQQLRDIVAVFLKDSKNDPAPPPRPTRQELKIADDGRKGSSAGRKSQPDADAASDPEPSNIAPEHGSSGPRKRARSVSDEDLPRRASYSENDSEDDNADEGVSASPIKRSRDSAASPPEGQASKERGRASATAGKDPGLGDSENNSTLDRVDGSRLTLEATASRVKETEIDLDLDDEEEEEEEEEDAADQDSQDGGDGGGAGVDGRRGGNSGSLDEQWSQAQEEKREREERERARAANEKALEEQRMLQQAQREKERVEEGMKLSRERAEEKARAEAAELERKNREKAELEEQKEAERLARSEARADVDLDQVRADPNLMAAMDSSIYDD